MILKLILTVWVLAAGGIVESIANSGTTLASGRLAGLQMNSSDTDYILSEAGQVGLNHIHLAVGGIGLLIIYAIWFSTLKKAFKKLTTMAFLIFALGMGNPNESLAYYSTTEKSEAYTILPNQSAIWIPDVGDNKNSQVQNNSEEFLQANKVYEKRFAIKHHKFQGSGRWSSFDKYVPDAV